MSSPRWPILLTTVWLWSGMALALPDAPTALIALSGDQSVTLHWEPVAGNATYTVSRRNLADSGPFTVIASGLSGTTYTDTGLTNGARRFYIVTANDGSGDGPPSNQARGTVIGPLVPGAAVWPLSGSGANDADEVRYLFGPRDIGSYDFHAGMDLNAAAGTPVHAVMAGTVTEVTAWDGVSSGSGNKVLINHGDQRWTAYLHLSAFADGLQVNDVVTAGQLIGYAGNSGASQTHLHFTYMVGLTSESVSESRSRSPLEILPHTTPSCSATMRGDGSNITEIELPAQSNTIRWILLKGQGQTRILDYHDIVAQGSSARDNPSQYGMRLDVDPPVSGWPAGGGTLRLRVSPDPADDFVPQQIILKDFNGNDLLDHSGFSNYEAWKIGHGYSPGAEDALDDDADGQPLLMEYALGTDPADRASWGRTELSLAGGQYRFTYPRAAPELSYEVQWSPDLETWSASGVDQSFESDGASTTAALPVDEVVMRFFRLKVLLAQ